jgi:DNA invertase Pin-like site-specific DNA recombinase
MFVHEEGDLRSFRMITTQLIITGTVSQAEVSRAFHVPLVTVKRCVKLHRERGPEGFFKPAKRREGRRLNEEALKQAQRLLEEGWSVAQVAQELGILATTLHKAIGDGRLRWERDEKKGPAGRGSLRRAKASEV